MSSSLNPENMNVPDRSLGRGHGTDALGPSDLSDTGSDIQGGPGWSRSKQVDQGSLNAGTTSDLERSTAGGTAGPDVGDANLDSDSDAGGTGEHAEAARDTVAEAGQDIDVDSVFQVDPDAADLADDEDRSA